MLHVLVIYDLHARCNPFCYGLLFGTAPAARHNPFIPAALCRTSAQYKHCKVESFTQQHVFVRNGALTCRYKRFSPVPDIIKEKRQR